MDDLKQATNGMQRAEPTKITLYHINNSRSQRVLWLLEELEIPYEIKKYQFTPDLLAPEELKGVHALGKAPIITDGDITVAESGAVIEYLLAKYGGEKFKPSDDGWLDNLYFTHYAEGSLMPLLVNKLVFTIVPQHTPFFIRPFVRWLFNTIMGVVVEPGLKENRAFIEQHLDKSSTGWFANGVNPTSADFMMFMPMTALQACVPCSGNNSTAVNGFVSKIQERPAYKRALEKGGGFKTLWDDF